MFTRISFTLLASALAFQGFAQTAPVITERPQSRMVLEGGAVTLRVTATGSQPLSYQWYRNGVAITGATAADYPISSARLADRGIYRVAVNDGTQTTWSVPETVLSAGATHSLFIAGDGGLWTMGESFDSQLCDTPTVYRDSPTPLATDTVATAAGAFDSFLIKSDGGLWAMGLNYYGQLGNNTLDHHSDPVAITANVIKVSTRNSHSLFLKADGSLWAMGLNADGQLGDGTTNNRLAPVSVATGVSAIAAGAFHSLFLKTDGSLWAMGNNNFGQLGDGTNVSRSSAVQITTGVRAVAAGKDFSLFVKNDGSLWAMGRNDFGQLGDGTTDERSSPVQVATDVAAIAAGTEHSLFVKTDGHLWAVGRNDFGQLGDATIEDRHTPVPVTANVVAIAAGTEHSLFLKSDGSLWAMGRGDSGQLGDGSLTARGGLSAKDGDTIGGTGPSTGNPDDTGGGIPNPDPEAPTDTDYGSSVPVQVGADLPAGALLQVVGQNEVTIDLWRQIHFSTAEQADPTLSGPLADPDDDGLPNLLEYALGLDPRVPDNTGGEAQIQEADGVLSYTYIRPGHREDISYTVERSTDLTQWSADGVTQARLQTEGDLELWKATTLLDGQKVFLRLKIDRTSPAP